MVWFSLLEREENPNIPSKLHPFVNVLHHPNVAIDLAFPGTPKRSAATATNNIAMMQRTTLPNFRVEFRFYSKSRKEGISSIVPYPSKLTRGVIYEVSEENMQSLDELESVPEGLYVRERVLVLDEDKDYHNADLYRVVNPEGPFTPARSYIELMVEGAEEHGLDPEYIENLKSLFSYGGTQVEMFK